MGAFIVQQWLAGYENNADKIVIAVGRLYANNIALPNPYLSAEANNHIALHLNKDYRPILEGRNLDNIFYITAKWDTSVYPISPSEKEWLDEKNIQRFEVEGGHSMVTQTDGTYLIVDVLFRM